ncbi:MAG: hypothetical protein MRY63_08985 [Neomegalonema sp.]|nr:hypothetical protein [Neomegalonema sp.]
MLALSPPREPLLVELLIHGIGTWRICKPLRPRPGSSIGLRLRASALETRPMPGGQRRPFVQEKQLGIARSHHLAAPSLERKLATDPALATPARGAEALRWVVKAPAAIAHQSPALGPRQDLAKRVHSILPRHGPASSLSSMVKTVRDPR